MYDAGSIVSFRIVVLMQNELLVIMIRCSAVFSCFGATVMAVSSALLIVCRSGCEIEIEIEIYPLQKGGIRTSFPRWGVTVLWKEGCMHVGPIVAPISTMAYIK